MEKVQPPQVVNVAFLIQILINFGLLSAVAEHWQLLTNPLRSQQLIVVIALISLINGIRRAEQLKPKRLSPSQQIREYYYWRSVGQGFPMVAAIVVTVVAIGWNALDLNLLATLAAAVAGIGIYFFGLGVGALIEQQSHQLRPVFLGLLALMCWKLFIWAGREPWLFIANGHRAIYPFLIVLCLTIIFGLLLVPISQIQPRFSRPKVALWKLEPILPTGALGTVATAIVTICLRDRRFQKHLVLAILATLVASYLFTLLSLEYLPLIIGSVISVFAGVALGSSTQTWMIVDNLARRSWPGRQVLWKQAAFWSSLVINIATTLLLSGLLMIIGGWTFFMVSLTALFSLAIVAIMSLYLSIRRSTIASGASG